MKIIDKLVDIIYKLCLRYKNKRRVEELRKRDPFIYH
jgi:hypothetical protein